MSCRALEAPRTHEASKARSTEEASSCTNRRLFRCGFPTRVVVKTKHPQGYCCKQDDLCNVMYHVASGVDIFVLFVVARFLCSKQHGATSLFLHCALAQELTASIEIRPSRGQHSPCQCFCSQEFRCFLPTPSRSNQRFRAPGAQEAVEPNKLRVQLVIFFTFWHGPVAMQNSGTSFGELTLSAFT